MYLYVTGKPRLHRVLPVHLGKVDTETKTLTCNFEVLAYPAPHQCNMWEPKRNSSETSNKEMAESMIMNVSCEPDARRRYVFRCTLTTSALLSPSVTGLHKIQIINEVGEGIFPTEICYGKWLLQNSKQCTHAHKHACIHECLYGHQSTYLKINTQHNPMLKSIYRET